jgi:hypothetical protein
MEMVRQDFQGKTISVEDLLSNAILLRAITLQKSPATFKSTSKLSKAVWSIYAIALSLGLYSSLLFFFSSIYPRHLCN